MTERRYAAADLRDVPRIGSCAMGHLARAIEAEESTAATSEADWNGVACLRGFSAKETLVRQDHAA